MFYSIVIVISKARLLSTVAGVSTRRGIFVERELNQTLFYRSNSSIPMICSTIFHKQNQRIKDIANQVRKNSVSIVRGPIRKFVCGRSRGSRVSNPVEFCHLGVLLTAIQTRQNPHFRQ